MGFKRKDIQDCVHCNRGVAHSNNITFYELKIKRYVLDLREIQKEHGLETFFGGGNQGATLASVMGANPDIAKELSKEIKVLICEDCAISNLLIAALHEEALDKLEKEKEKHEE